MSERDRGRGLSLAARLRASLDSREAADRRAREEEARRREAAKRQRVELLRDLEAFGHALGHADVTATGQLVAIRLGDRVLRFEIDGDGGDVRVTGDGLSPGWVLRRNDELERWGLHPPHGAARLLFDAGLEELVGRAFALRAPDPDPSPVEERDDLSRDGTAGPRKRSL
ncbi:MAG: hypothetical protein H6742_16440 [Alphaproteobacteria bacterium]|nr:hypothetical protein [Alphaproteobacteria bacterium]